VDAVLGVDLKPRFTTLAIDKFIHARRAVALFRARIDRQVNGRGYFGVLERQMNRLIFLVIGVRDEHRRKAIEGENAVGLRIIDRGRLVLPADCRVIGPELQRPREPDLQIVEPHVESGIERSCESAPVSDGRLRIAHGP
jgi:hypothetical protein